MAILEPYIPREYLALQINYCKQQLAMLPEVSMTYHMIRGERIRIFKCKKHTIKADSPNGKELEIIYWQREELLRKLSRLDGLWNCYFRGLPPSGIAPRKIQRKLYISSTESVIIDSKFFDSLENDADPNYREGKTCFYNGIYYRSTAEVDIARYYTETGTPFKYEPEIWIKGLNYPIYPDFVFLIKELDLCKVHEHFGMKNFANYAQALQVKCSNYSNAGLVMDFDVINTYSFDSIPFDLRMLATKINHAVYDSLFAMDIPC